MQRYLSKLLRSFNVNVFYFIELVKKTVHVMISMKSKTLTICDNYFNDITGEFIILYYTHINQDISCVLFCFFVKKVIKIKRKVNYGRFNANELKFLERLRYK